jgi:hypothetical protein
MQSEEFDKKVNEAADHHYPAYDEKAWAKMERLLDKHLPQKNDDRRKYILLLLLFLLTGGGVYLMIAKPWQSNKPLVVSDKTVPQDIPANSIKIADAGNSEKINDNNNIDISERPIPGETIEGQRKKQQPIAGINKAHQINKTNLVLETTDPLFLQENKAIVDPLKNNETVRKNKNAETINEVAGNNNDIVNSSPEKTAGNKSIDEQKINTRINTDSTQSKTDATSPSVAKKTKTSIKKSNSFFLSLSTGPDISFAGLEHLGKIKLLAGAGFGYTFRNKFILRTGFYTARKIYSAQPYQYHTTGIPNPNYTLQRVDADCRVYEIPLLLSYNFSHSVRQSWFATAGVSSYLMKRETYNYQYKNSTGQVYTHQWTLKDKNKHYFSILTLSGGYQQKINNTFSIMAEPYVKIPMVGIGSGKVKLNSAGVLLSVGINLFGSTKNKAGN